LVVMASADDPPPTPVVREPAKIDGPLRAT
jgi:hypothetical protein